jgi:hypothetical protein
MKCITKVVLWHVKLHVACSSTVNRATAHVLRGRLCAGLLDACQLASGRIDTGFLRLPLPYRQMPRCLRRFQLAPACFSCSPLDLNVKITPAKSTKLFSSPNLRTLVLTSESEFSGPYFTPIFAPVRPLPFS